MTSKICTALAVVLSFVGAARATNMQDLLRDTQRTSQDGTHLTFVWWLPQAYWEMSLSANPVLSPEGRTQILKALDNYMFFVLLRAETGIGGIAEASSREELLLNASLKVGGDVVQPVFNDSLPTSVYTMVSSLKPLLARTLGQLGQSVEIVVYPGKRDGKPIIDPSATGSFTFTLFDQTFNWHLPLGSLMPPKFDPRTKEQFPGNYDFNPYTGAKLSTQP